MKKFFAAIDCGRRKLERVSRMPRHVAKIFLPLILSAVIFLTGCGQSDSPEAALNEISLALAERDAAKLSERVNLDEFFAATYDAATVELAARYDDYKTRYPDDPYFQRDAEFITNYNAAHKALHLKFLDGVQSAYFAKIPAPVKPEDNPTAYVANEFESIRQTANVTIRDTRLADDRATLVIDVHGDNSLRGQFIGQLTFELSFRRDADNRWHFESIENLDALTPTLVDKAELVWINF